MSKTKFLLLAAILALVALFFVFDLGQYLTLERLKAEQARILAFRDAHPGAAALYFVVFYVLVTGLSLPGAGIMTLAGGAVFGLWWGTALVSVASTLGATVAFLVARFLLRETVQERFSGTMRAINAGVERDGAFYLFTMRLVPAFPFFVINLVMALTPLRAWTFVWVSWLGMLPGTLVFVNAGTALAGVGSLGDVLSPGVALSFVALGVFPFVARRLVDAARAARAYRGWPRPRRFDRDLVVIGAGSAGLVSAYVGAAMRARVTLVERGRMGGDCLNTGCVPSKALIRTARFLAQARRGAELGVRSVAVDFDFADAMARVRRVIAAVEPHDSVERYEALGVECVSGEARLESPFSVRVGERVITARAVIIAAGARPFVPPIPGLAQAGYLTSDTLWDLDRLPRRLAVLGGGPIGCELAQCFARLGSRVTQIEMLPRLLVREDPEVSAMVARHLAGDGVDLRLGHRARRVERRDGERVLVCEHEGERVEIPCDEILVAVGRKANTEGYGLEELGIALTGSGTVAVNEYLQTRFPNVYACGDVAGPYQFTHMSSHQAGYAASNALLGAIWKRRVDYSVVPWVTFTDPEVARVGLNETEARERAVPYELTVYPISDLDRALADGAPWGEVRILTPPGKDRILGATIVAAHAGELLAELVAAMRNGFGLNRILGTIHPYPTWTEANRNAAGAWRRAHVPDWSLALLERYHAWRRGGPAPAGPLAGRREG